MRDRGRQSGAAVRGQDLSCYESCLFANEGSGGAGDRRGAWQRDGRAKDVVGIVTPLGFDQPARPASRPGRASRAARRSNVLPTGSVMMRHLLIRDDEASRPRRNIRRVEPDANMDLAMPQPARAKVSINQRSAERRRVSGFEGYASPSSETGRRRSSGTAKVDQANASIPIAVGVCLFMFQVSHGKGCS